MQGPNLYEMAAIRYLEGRLEPEEATMIDEKTTWAMVTLAAMLLAGATSASATEGRLYDWSSSEAPVLVENEHGLIFLGKDREPWRAYHWDRAEGDEHDGSYIVDMDNDGKHEMIGAGDPTFKLEQDSHPEWSLEKGCDQVIVADFGAGKSLDLMCQRGSHVAIYTHDQQKIWSADMGVTMDWCRAGDINGDLQADLECKYRGRESFIRIDSEGEILAQGTEETEIPEDAVDLDEAQPVGAEILEGEREFDLNGDGTAEESLLADGEAVVLQSRSKDKAVARIELDGKPASAIVKNLDGEGTPEIVILTDSSIVVADGSGEKLGTYSANAREYERYPVANLDNVYARDFSDTEKAQQTVRDAQSDLAGCYERRVRGTLVVSTGQVIWKVYVDENGEVSGTEQMHSDLGDETVESCALDVLKGLDYPAAKKAEDSEEESSNRATVNVTLKFTFADRP